MRLYRIDQSDTLCVVVPSPDYNNTLTKQFIFNISRSDTHPSIIVIESSGKEFNFSKSMNAGIREALRRKPEYVMISNNDVIPIGQDWAKSLIDSLTAFPSTAYAVPHIIRHEDLSSADSIIRLPNRVTARAFIQLYPILPARTFPVVARIRDIGYRLQKPHPARNDTIHAVRPPYHILNCQPISIFKADTLESIGYFDEAFQNGAEDLDLTIRTLLSGFKPVLCRGAIFKDIQSATMGEGWANALYTHKKNYRSINNWDYLLAKHGREYDRILNNRNLFYTA